MAQARGFIYSIIAPSGWSKPKIKYRRHRLAEYLIRQKDTEDVIWIYPVSATPRIAGSYKKANDEIRNNFCNHFNKDGIKECALPDFMPGRFMKFKTSFGNLRFQELKRIIDSYNAHKVLCFTYPIYPYLAKIVDWDLVAYDCSDLWSEPSDGFRADGFSKFFFDNLITAAEQSIINSSKVILASSEFLAERINKTNGRKVDLIENGVDQSQFERSVNTIEPILKDIPSPRLGFVGGMKGKIDFDLLSTVAIKNPDWSIVLVGPSFFKSHEAYSRLLERDNVYSIGQVKAELIPDYISGLQVGLLPYREIEYNKASFPLKFYEYLAQGIPVVGCGVPSTKKHIEEKVFIHVERKKFEEACKKVLSWLEDDSEADKRKRVELARKAIWEEKLRNMHAIFKKAVN